MTYTCTNILDLDFSYTSLPGKTILKSICISEMMKMLQCCNNVTHLILPALDHLNSPFDSHEDEQLMKVIQEMKHLKVLNIHCYHDQPW